MLFEISQSNALFSIDVILSIVAIMLIDAIDAIEPIPILFHYRFQSISNDTLSTHLISIAFLLTNNMGVQRVLLEPYAMDGQTAGRFDPSTTSNHHILGAMQCCFTFI